MDSRAAVGEEEATQEVRPGLLSHCSFVAAVSNFAIQYNYGCASMATMVMLSHGDLTGPGQPADFPEPQWAKEYMLSIVFIGSVVGMLTMGYLGDVLGIRRALIFTNTLTVLGALASALLSWGSASTVWGVVTLSRFVLGMGVGGNYPLSAAKASQGVQLHEAISKAGAAFFWQGPGSIAPYLFGLVLLQLPQTEVVTSIQFRLLLGAGALPAAVVLWATIREPDVVPRQRSQEKQQAMHSRRHWYTLVGTCGTWFLFDVAFYGMVIFSPVILKSVFGAQQTLTELAIHAAMMSGLGMVGTALGVVVLPLVGAKRMAVWGLVAAGCMFAAFAAIYQWHPERSNLLFACLCGLFFTLYMGPNIATFILPVEAFPEDVRSTFHGLSAAGAKVGAMAGAMLFPIINNHFGIPTVMGTQAVICVFGALLSQVTVKNDKDLEDTTEIGWATKVANRV